VIDKTILNRIKNKNSKIDIHMSYGIPYIYIYT